MKLRSFVLAIMFLVPIALLRIDSQSRTHAFNIPQGTEFSCSSVTEIPRKECEALVALYNSTSGPEWTNNQGWLKTTTPCSWHGINCQMLLGKVSHLWLPDNNLNGTIPDELGSLDLWWLYLPDNKLMGSIPASVASANFTQIVLRNNRLTGAIPSEIGASTGLLALDVGHNNLEGELPDALGQLRNLGVLNVSHNSFYGALPRDLMDLHSLFNFSFDNTGLCEPADMVFQEWLSSIRILSRTGRKCGTRPWTLMYYFATDNNLAVYLDNELNMLMRAGDNEAVNITYFYDKRDDQGALYGGIASSHFRYSIWMDEPSTGEPEVLTDFIKWAQKEYPAENYALVLVDHAYGITGFGRDENASGDQKECWSDSTQQWGSCLTFKELNEALIPIPKLDIIYIAACSSATIEVGYELREQSDYLVASEQIAWTPRDHSLYIRGSAGINENTTAEVLAIRMANSYVIEKEEPLTSSVVRVSDVQNVVDKTNHLGGLLQDDMGDVSGILEDIRFDVQHFSTGLDLDIAEDDAFDLVDLWDAAVKVKERIEDPEIQNAADELIAALDDYVVWNYSRSGSFKGIRWMDQCPPFGKCNWHLEDSYGVSVYWPDQCPSFYSEAWLDFAAGADCENNGSLGTLALGESNGWASMLVEYVRATNPDAPNNSTPPPLAEPISTLTFSYLPFTGR